MSRQRGDVGEELRRAEALLADAGVPTPRIDAELLVAHALGLSRSELALQRDRR